MKIRILSDLHLDVNSNEPFSLKDKDTFTVLCGDISGDPEITKEWICENLKSGVFVAGNHLVYNSRGKSIQELREEMASGDTGDVTYLDCMVKGCPITKEIDKNTVIIGSTMYTNFKLRGKYDQNQPEDLIIMRNKRLSLGCMNDYCWGQVKKEDGTMRSLHPDDLEEGFTNFFCELRAFSEANPNKSIIVVTHYCPSAKSISEEYLDNNNNSSYVSELDDFILKHPNIKLWCCGHVHHQGSYKIGDCLVVMNPRGYVGRLEDKKFDSRLYVDTKDWSLHRHRKTADEKAKYEARRNEFLKYAPFFI